MEYDYKEKVINMSIQPQRTTNGKTLPDRMFKVGCRNVKPETLKELLLNDCDIVKLMELFKKMKVFDKI